LGSSCISGGIELDFPFASSGQAHEDIEAVEVEMQIEESGQGVDNAGPVARDDVGTGQYRTLCVSPVQALGRSRLTFLIVPNHIVAQVDPGLLSPAALQALSQPLRLSPRMARITQFVLDLQHR
jgi:hypothetical protein